MKRMFALPTSMVCLAACLLTGCSGAGGNPGGTGSPGTSSASGAASAIDPDRPLQLSLYQYSAHLTDEEFQTLLAEPLKKKYPNVTLQLVRSAKGSTPAELLTAGSMPDIIYTGSGGAAAINELQAAQDLNGLVKKFGIDMGKFDPTGLEAIKQYSDKGQLLAFPFGINFSVLYYNKDIFDKFATAYPKDGMSWDEAIQLTRKVSREEGGVQYSGLDIDVGVQRLGEQLVLPLVDPKTLQASLQTDGWKKVLSTFQQLKGVPGNNTGKNQITAFLQDRTLAMHAGFGARLGELEELYNTGKPMNWDLAAMPHFSEAPQNAFGTNLFQFMLSSTTKYPDQAFEVMNYFTSEEVQTLMNKRGRRTSLKDPKYHQSFGEELQSLKGKNVDAIFKMTPAPLPQPTLYDGTARSEMVAAASNVVKGVADINTALRTADENANKKIQELKAQ